jgi:Holliday junction resolvase
MTPSKSKISGTYFEKEVEEFFGGKRVIGSGAFGNYVTSLQGDVKGIKLPIIPDYILAECKFGYGGTEQITIKREWITKLRQQAKANKSLPALIVKMKGVHGDKEDRESAKLFILNWDTMKYICDILEEYEEAYVKLIEKYEKEKG